MIYNNQYISIIIPIFNEEENIFNLLYEIELELENFINYEIIIVNDNSEDGFLDKFHNSKFKSFIKLFNNDENLGQSKSIKNGISMSKYKNIVTIDGDGQNNPKDIKKLCDKYFQGKYSLVSGIRLKRKDNRIKVFSSKIANYVRSRLLDDNCPDTACGLKIFKKNIFLDLPFFNGIHRFIPALFLSMSQKVYYLPIDHRQRVYGDSKYGTLDRLFKGIIDIFRVMLIIKKIKK